MQIVIAGQAVREFSVELAENEPADWWAFYDVSAFIGQTIRLIALEELLGSQAAWLSGVILQSDQILNSADLYHENYRPQFHFTSRRGWNNDPNGLVYTQGEWHLYYQHNPFGIRWGNMHWGHAVSQDLIHWTELPEALFQKSLHDMAFSGGGLVDIRNSAGLKAGPEDPLVVAFTSTGRGECLAYSLDRGRTLVEYPHNPIITHKGRDPKIIWYEPGQHWVLILYEEPFEEGVGSGGHGTASSFGYAIYTSPNLKLWSHMNVPSFSKSMSKGSPASKNGSCTAARKTNTTRPTWWVVLMEKSFSPRCNPLRLTRDPAFTRRRSSTMPQTVAIS